MDLIPPSPDHPPEDYIEYWNSELTELVRYRREFFKIRDYLIRENWSRESCVNVIEILSYIQINNENNAIFLFLLDKCFFHLML